MRGDRAVSAVSGGKLIDILPVLGSFHDHSSPADGAPGELAQAASSPVVVGPPETISVGLASDGSLWINQSAVKLDDLRGFFLNVSWLSALIVLIFQGDGSLEFGAVAHVMVVRRFAGGLATSELEKNR